MAMTAVAPKKTKISEKERARQDGYDAGYFDGRSVRQLPDAVAQVDREFAAPDTLLAAVEAAEALGLSEQILLVLHALGIGPRSYLLGERRLYRYGDLVDWRGQPGRSAAELKAGISCVLDMLHEVAVEFGEIAPLD
jgi:hypothetical protein